jgi:hypothetical protein
MKLIKYTTAKELLEGHIKAMELTDPNKFDQNYYCANKCGCVMWHHDNMFGMVESVTFNLLLGGHYHYCFGTIESVKEAAEELGYPIPRKFTPKTAIDRMKRVIKDLES